MINVHYCHMAKTSVEQVSYTALLTKQNRGVLYVYCFSTNIKIHQDYSRPVLHFLLNAMPSLSLSLYRGLALTSMGSLRCFITLWRRGWRVDLSHAHLLHRWWVHDGRWSDALGIKPAFPLAMLLAHGAAVQSAMNQPRIAWRILMKECNWSGDISYMTR